MHDFIRAVSPGTGSKEGLHIKGATEKLPEINHFTATCHQCDVLPQRQTLSLGTGLISHTIPFVSREHPKPLPAQNVEKKNTYRPNQGSN